MFASKGKTTVIAEGLRIVGNVSADGAVQVNGQIDGDLNCTSITISPKAFINGAVKARSVVVNGKVKGPISGEDVVLNPHAFPGNLCRLNVALISRVARFGQM
jgi:cytoskeletal protein CcmA (bactofilin family)